MQFKGTPEFPAGELDRAISRFGGHWNAHTGTDWTVYEHTLPAEHAELGLRVEADRMVNSLFSPREVEHERTVIISEREMHENEPTFRLSEELLAAAFRVHPYHHEVIGDMPDLRNMSRQDLYQHYRTYYRPAGAVLALAGDFHTPTMLRTIRRLFGGLPSGRVPAFEARPEPPQRGERRLVVEGPGETSFLEIAYHAPTPRSPDFLPLSVLDSVLAGPASLNMYGGGISNKTSRLYRALVERGFAASVGGDLAASVDPYLYSIGITVRPDRMPEQALEAFDAEVERLRQEPIRADEVAKAVKQSRALFAYGSESITNQAFWLGFSEMFADYAWFETYLDRLAQVTVEQVEAAARTYLRPSNRIVGIYRPTGAAGVDDAG
jgi:zinc protease